MDFDHRTLHRSIPQCYIIDIFLYSYLCYIKCILSCYPKWKIDVCTIVIILWRILSMLFFLFFFGLFLLFFFGFQVLYNLILITYLLQYFLQKKNLLIKSFVYFLQVLIYMAKTFWVQNDLCFINWIIFVFFMQYNLYEYPFFDFNSINDDKENSNKSSTFSWA